jgi:hypothetical protein
MQRNISIGRGPCSTLFPATFAPIGLTAHSTRTICAGAAFCALPPGQVEKVHMYNDAKDKQYVSYLFICRIKKPCA